MSNLCACGCGEPAPVGKRCRKSHNLRGCASHRWRGGTYTDRKGYVYLYRPDHHRANKKGYVHRAILVFEEATGLAVAPDHDVHHINGIVDDDTPGNLAAMSHGDHKRLHIAATGGEGVRFMGERNGSAKLTDQIVRDIRSLRGIETQEQLANTYGVSASQIGRILSGECWPDLDGLAWQGRSRG